MSESVETAAIEPPQKYDFHDWNVFCHQALRYHEATFPGKNLVSDRIETFSHYMSQAAIDHLGGYMRPHPRYKTSEGWDDWITQVGIALSDRDDTATRHQPVKPVDWAEHFQSGNISAARLWEVLDRFVVSEELSSTDQRELFWSAMSTQQRHTLRESCPDFDPRSEVWRKVDKVSQQKAEQKLAHIMERSLTDEAISRSKRDMIQMVIVFSLVLFFSIFWFKLTSRQFGSSHVLRAVCAMWVSVGLVFVLCLLMFACLLPEIFKLLALLEKRKKQKKLARNKDIAA